MKIKLIVTDTKPLGFTTCGYWRFTEPHNKGTLEIYVARMKSRRHFLAVLGHECIEVAYCWLFGVTTEAADEFDKVYERGYAMGAIPMDWEPGHNAHCCYHWGHMLGVLWEHIWIYGTFGNFRAYCQECDEIMQIFARADVVEKGA